MNEFWEKLLDVIPTVWGCLLVTLVTLLIVGGVIWSAQWILELTGVL